MSDVGTADYGNTWGLFPCKELRAGWHTEGAPQMLVMMTSLPPTTNQGISFLVGSHCAKVIPYTALTSTPPSLILGSTNPR